jgi:copper chaperone NosL
MKFTNYTLITLLVFSQLACSPSPQPIKFGHDQCVYCKMIISDQRYGAEIVTNKGKIYKYDSVECLVAAYIKADIDHNTIHSLWVVDFNQTPTLIDARTARYLHSEQLRSPMGLNLTAYKAEKSDQGLLQEYAGTVITWDQVTQLVREKWVNK